ncbi:cysteine--tRNA ligase [Candidatus Gracilibacteria bacterium]|nr:cysteine--tRNA ligase [Candidatus Gracilibacteria bacterium]
MKLYDTLTRSKKEFKPLNGNTVGMYVCGPTVYDVGHLGHARSAVAFDVVRRYLRYKGYEVNFVSNVTDVDDKMIKRAQLEKITEAQLAEKIIPEYEKDYGALNVLPPTHQPRATQYIPQMVALIEKLIEKKAAYVTDDGVYFRVSTRSDYGKLSGQKVDELRAGSRIAVDEKKEHSEDFALWKKAKPGEPTWEGPQGIVGRPGWHIECSAMSAELLGETFDIHGGGADLIFPHHEDEIAQSESASGKEFARFWLHNGHVQVNKEKMSKSLGNFFTIKDMLAKWHPAVLRYFLISTHYRLPIDFSDELLQQAKNTVERIRGFINRITKVYSPSATAQNDLKGEIETAETQFQMAMDDDFQISLALAALHDLINYANLQMDKEAVSKAGIEQLQNFLSKTDTVLGLFSLFDIEHGTSAQIEKEEVESLIGQMEYLRQQKKYTESDAIRKQLTEKGVIVKNTPNGPTWERAI